MFRALIAAVCALLLSAAAAPPAAGRWRPAPEFVPLFTPARPAGAYEAFVSPDPLDAVLRTLEADPAILRPPGAWVPVAATARDALGREGTHNPWTLARLYGATRARVARGPRGTAGRTVESWTLVSPHPDPSLGRLDPGTLLIVVRLP